MMARGPTSGPTSGCLGKLRAAYRQLVGDQVTIRRNAHHSFSSTPRQGDREKSPYLGKGGGGTSPSAVLRSKRSTKNLCAVRRSVLIGEYQTLGTRQTPRALVAEARRRTFVVGQELMKIDI
jgi:hypothetical protein